MEIKRKLESIKVKDIAIIYLHKMLKSKCKGNSNIEIKRTVNNRTVKELKQWKCGGTLGNCEYGRTLGNVGRWGNQGELAGDRWGRVTLRHL